MAIAVPDLLENQPVGSDDIPGEALPQVSKPPLAMVVWALSDADTAMNSNNVANDFISIVFCVIE